MELLGLLVKKVARKRVDIAGPNDYTKIHHMSDEKEQYRKEVSAKLDLPIEDIVVEDLYTDERGTHHFRFYIKFHGKN